MSLWWKADEMCERLCFEIPRTGGRLLETGTKNFLKLRRDGHLGKGTLISSYLAVQVATYPSVKVPFIIVLTKYDEIVNQVDYDLGPSLDGLSDDNIEELIKKGADDELRKTCIEPLKAFAGPDIPYAAVSSGYRHSDRLVRA
jgi:hypothetical protein